MQIKLIRIVTAHPQIQSKKSKNVRRYFTCVIVTQTVTQLSLVTYIFFVFIWRIEQYCMFRVGQTGA